MYTWWLNNSVAKVSSSFKVVDRADLRPTNGIVPVLVATRL